MYEAQDSMPQNLESWSPPSLLCSGHETVYSLLPQLLSRPKACTCIVNLGSFGAAGDREVIRQI